MISLELLKKYCELKEKYADAVILFRSTDNYIMLMEDAVHLTEILNTPMQLEKGVCSISFNFTKIDEYVPKIVRNGFRVAICEEL